MRQVVIENPIINSPFCEPTRHFRFTDEGITNEVIDGRRTSSYFVPIAQPRKKGQKQLVFDSEWTQDRIEGPLGRITKRPLIRYDSKGTRSPVRKSPGVLLALYRHGLCHELNASRACKRPDPILVARSVKGPALLAGSK